MPKYWKTRTKRFIRSEAKSKLFVRTELYINKNFKNGIMQTSWELFDQGDDVRVMIIMKCNFNVYVSREISKTISKYLNSNIMEITDLLKEPKGNAKNGRNMWVLQNCLKNLFSFNIEEVTNLLPLPPFLAVAAENGRIR